ncbi:MAG TPA: CBS domain-containing protein [Nitrospinae bacterium]|nr:CBS domain-containing protein [Nitrospinota bacterium]HBA26292.1 CBS domain-containing protein [Nitrospinota bacterium]
MTLKEVMKKDIVTITPNMSVREAAKKMKDEKIGCLLVTENDSLRGILTDRDIVCTVVANGKDPNYTMVKDIMNGDVVYTSPDTDIFEAFKIMAGHKIRRLPLKFDGRLEGIVSISDLAPILKREMDDFFHVEEIYHH